eukprot:3852310-Prymnesium_polylepis.1
MASAHVLRRELCAQHAQCLEMRRLILLVACHHHPFECRASPAAPHGGLHLVQVGTSVAVEEVDRSFDKSHLLDRALLGLELHEPLLLVKNRIHEAYRFIVFAAVEHAAALVLLGDVEHEGDEKCPHDDTRAR